MEGSEIESLCEKIYKRDKKLRKIIGQKEIL